MAQNKYYVVVDLEFAKVRGLMKNKFGRGTEIIQLGAVLLDHTYAIVRKFNSYVTPCYARLDEEIRKLTGIRERQLAGSPNILAVLDRFAEWLPDDADITCVEWSNSDREQLDHEIEFHNYRNVKLAAAMENWVDCQAMFGEFMNHSEKPYSLQEALSATVLENPDMKDHDGLSDAYNTSLLFAGIMSKKLKINDYYKHLTAVSSSSDSSESGCTLGDLFANLLNQVA